MVPPLQLPASAPRVESVVALLRLALAVRRPAEWAQPRFLAELAVLLTIMAMAGLAVEALAALVGLVWPAVPAQRAPQAAEVAGKAAERLAERWLRAWRAQLAAITT